MKNEKKLNYETAEIEIIVFETKDILTTSGFPGDWEDLAEEEKVY